MCSLGLKRVSVCHGRVKCSLLYQFLHQPRKSALKCLRARYHPPIAIERRLNPATVEALDRDKPGVEFELKGPDSTKLRYNQGTEIHGSTPMVVSLKHENQAKSRFQLCMRVSILQEPFGGSIEVRKLEGRRRPCLIRGHSFSSSSRLPVMRIEFLQSR